MVQAAPPPPAGDGPQRFELLDALRGLAALAVLSYHLGTRVRAPMLVAHGYLAVDFFFMLSGFVLAHAYGRRLPEISIARFAMLRARRLLPLSMLGIALGTVYLLLRLAFQPGSSDTLPQLAGATALNLVLLPKPWLGAATQGELFPANGAMWSLSLEMIVNLAWAACIGRMRPWVGLAAATLAAMALIAFVRHGGTADLGWDWETYPGGLARATFGFFAGIALYRWRPRLRPHRLWPWLSTVALLAILAIPVHHWMIDAGAVLIAFPVILLIAAGAAFRRVPPVVEILGDISYPLYALHVPLLMFVSGGVKALMPDSTPGIAIHAVAIPIVALSWLAGHYYDRPVSRWFADARVRRRALLSA